MTIVIFGASGATGHHLISQGLERGHQVVAFARDPSKMKIQNKNFRIVKGDVSDPHRVEEAVRGSDAVISALGASNPWKHDDALIKGIENIVDAMTKFHIRRLIYQSFLGVKEHRSDFGFLLNRVIPFLLRGSVKDHEVKEAIITNSSLQWTIVRCPTLTNGPFTGNYLAGERILSASVVPSLSRADTADFILKELQEDNYIGKKPRIMKK